MLEWQGVLSLWQKIQQILARAKPRPVVKYCVCPGAVMVQQPSTGSHLETPYTPTSLITAIIHADPNNHTVPRHLDSFQDGLATSLAVQTTAAYINTSFFFYYCLSLKVKLHITLSIVKFQLLCPFICLRKTMAIRVHACILSPSSLPSNNQSFNQSVIDLSTHRARKLDATGPAFMIVQDIYWRQMPTFWSRQK